MKTDVYLVLNNWNGTLGVTDARDEPLSGLDDDQVLLHFELEVDERIFDTVVRTGETLTVSAPPIEDLVAKFKKN